jgi:hypothetical protein
LVYHIITVKYDNLYTLGKKFDIFTFYGKINKKIYKLFQNIIVKDIGFTERGVDCTLGPFLKNELPKKLFYLNMDLGYCASLGKPLYIDKLSHFICTYDDEGYMSSEGYEDNDDLHSLMTFPHTDIPCKTAYISFFYLDNAFLEFIKGVKGWIVCKKNVQRIHLSSRH